MSVARSIIGFPPFRPLRRPEGMGHGGIRHERKCSEAPEAASLLANYYKHVKIDALGAERNEDWDRTWV